MAKAIQENDATRPEEIREAHGQPGIDPVWAAGAKSIVGASACEQSQVWFTVGRGILNEIYYPDIDQANTRAIRFLISDGETFFSDEESDAEHHVTWLGEGVPGCRIESRCHSGRYTLEKEIFAHPVRNLLLMRVRFSQPAGSAALKLYLYAEPHVCDQGTENEGWIGAYKGVPMMFAQRDRTALAVATLPHFQQATSGYAGKSDGYSSLSKFEPLPQSNGAPCGNVKLTAEIDYASNGGAFVVCLGFGSNSAQAGLQARAGTLEDLDKACVLFEKQWKEKHAGFEDIADLSEHALNMYRVSTTVLETHQSKRFAGGFIASLSTPWGFDRSDGDVGGYHVLWPRDMAETAMGKIACGDARSARATLFYLTSTQENDGSWSQNMWLDGTPYWNAKQMDAMALPILLAEKLHSENELDGYDPAPMIHLAAKFLLQNGPVTEQDRWETTPGYSPYTMATEIAALLAAADFADLRQLRREANFLRDTADAWSDCIDEFTYVENTPLAKAHGIKGYYVRMTPPERVAENATGNLKIKVPNMTSKPDYQKAIDIISPDALALVRFGLRSAHDPRITDTLKVIDATLKFNTATGLTFTRSTNDGYGENDDGTPFKKTGVGRGWPLLSGERAHYELAYGNRAFALELLKTMARQTSECGMIPEQVWNAADIPEHRLFNGRPGGSGMPLVWAHSEYIKLLRSLHAGSVWDMPKQTVERYVKGKKTAAFQIWTEKQQRGWLTKGKKLRIDLTTKSTVKWGVDTPSNELQTEDPVFGLHCVMLDTSSLAHGDKIQVKVEPHNEEGKEEKKPLRFFVRVHAGG